jgi:hypothetical protein
MKNLFFLGLDTCDQAQTCALGSVLWCNLCI